MRHKYKDITSFENLLESWQEFLNGKKKRNDIAEFSVNFLDNISSLQKDLAEKCYKHGPYEPFKINDPKPRDIHKASVRDRIMHHAIYRGLYPHLDRKFIFDSYSCRIGKGTHRAINRFREFARKVSQNNTKTCWVLKCDIRKFFASIDHLILKDILKKDLKDWDVLWLLNQVIDSFHTEGKSDIGLPLGNLTSQLLVNVYMNVFDQFIKRVLKIKYYIRYADDFVIFSRDKDYLLELTPKIGDFLEERLKLSLHPNKVFIKTFASGVDFLGWINFPYHRMLRTATKKRMFRNIKSKQGKKETVESYLGLLKHGNARKLEKEIENMNWE